MNTSVVVLNYNDWRLTQNYVTIISSYACVDHIVIVDNCSPDGSYERLKTIASPKIDIIKTASNKGYAAGNNEGIRFIIDKYGDSGVVVISNPDIRISQESFSTILNTFEKYPEQFAVTGEVYNLSGKRIPLFTWKLPTYGMLLAQNCIVLRVLLKKVLGYGKEYTNIREIDKGDFYLGEALPGCFFAADIKKLKELGLFSENTFLYYEEDILFYKAKECGYISKVIKNAQLVHEEGTTTKKNVRSWVKRESFFEASCIAYMKECLHICSLGILLHKFLYLLFLPERYVCEKIKLSGVKK